MLNGEKDGSVKQSGGVYADRLISLENLGIALIFCILAGISVILHLVLKYTYEAPNAYANSGLRAAGTPVDPIYYYITIFIQISSVLFTVILVEAITYRKVFGFKYGVSIRLSGYSSYALFLFIPMDIIAHGDFALKGLVYLPSLLFGVVYFFRAKYFVFIYKNSEYRPPEGSLTGLIARLIRFINVYLLPVAAALFIPITNGISVLLGNNYIF